MGGLDHRAGFLLASMRKRRLDAYLCVRLSNIRYLTGFTGSNAVLVVATSGSVLITDGRYTEQARSEVRGAEVEVTSDAWSAAARRMRALRARRIGFESRHLSVDSFRTVSRGGPDRFVAAQDLVAAIRMRKEPGEILAIERATTIATASLLSTLSSVVRGKMERDVAADLVREMIRRGAEGVSFPPIVADGPRSAMPHAAPSGALITGEGPLVLDFGARWNGYCSDETVTVLPRHPRSPLGKAFDAVRRAQAAGISSVRPGELCRAVDARVRDSLDRSGYLKYFVHSTGHGVGLDVHELPSLSPRSRERLDEGMVITVEPGVYLPGIGGIRLEDTVKVTGSGCERITFLPKTHTPLV